MRIGTGLFSGQRRPDDDRSMTEIYDEMIELGKHAEEVGLDSLWASEHHFAEDAYLPGVSTTLGGLATATDDIQIGTSMILAPLHNPVRLAENAATLSLLSNGRFTLGVANGYRDVEFKNFGIPKRERANRTEEAIKIARRAWSDGPLDYQPLFADVSEDAMITPKPDIAPEITIGGLSKNAVRRSAQMADGWTAPEMTSLDDIAKRKRYIERLRDVEKKSGDFTVYIQRYCYVDESEEAAWETIQDSLFYVQRKYDEWFGLGNDGLSQERKQEIRDYTMVGSPEEIAEELDEYEDVLGDDIHMILRTYHPGIGTENLRRTNEMIGDEIAPQFQ
ncbi:LLM class flavin-dependent oxidoreductase [Halostagnicola sp. GCM10023398]|uniref:LLM class flavin-dependent oxidoreductase n=2 Tax=Natrialbaceae TaxID=1644061 RepID=UPI00360CA6F6